MYKPKAPFNVNMILLVPISKKYVNGKLKKEYSKPTEVTEDMNIFGSFRTFGGTETNVNGVYTIINTAVIETWYRPDIKADCRIYIPDLNATYDIIQPPEDIERRHQYLKFKVQKVGGEA